MRDWLNDRLAALRTRKRINHDDVRALGARWSHPPGMPPEDEEKEQVMANLLATAREHGDQPAVRLDAASAHLRRLARRGCRGGA